MLDSAMKEKHIIWQKERDFWKSINTLKSLIKENLDEV